MDARAGICHHSAERLVLRQSNLASRAAAAGSGKTAVLVERIITRLKDMDNPLSVQELMVVTFTKAAAQEMSARIGLALAKAMESTEDAAMQERLERQLNLLPSAHISTLHSFCQWVIRSYFISSILTRRLASATKRRWHCYNKRY